MPVSILEAMAAGKAVIATDIVGNKDLIENGVTGVLCDPQAADEWAQRLRELLNSESRRAMLGKQAKDYVSQYHDMRKAVRMYKQMYLRGPAMNHIAFFCSTPYHVLVATWLRFSSFRDTEADMYLLDHFKDAQAIHHTLTDTQMFSQVKLLHNKNGDRR